MACFHPITGWRQPGGTVNNKQKYGFNPAKAYKHAAITINCGQCVGCRLERSRQWAARILHESKLYDENEFITLTYDEENLPEKDTLKLKDFQNFMKRLRKHVSKLKKNEESDFSIVVNTVKKKSMNTRGKFKYRVRIITQSYSTMNSRTEKRIGAKQKTASKDTVRKN